MDDGKRMLLDWIAEDEEILVEFLSAFVQAKSPNPPGDTREAAAHVCGLLDREGLAYRVIAPKAEFPNVVASFEGGEKGRHLVLNGHMDVFPVGEHEQWRFGAWSGAVAEGAVWGRGSADMKCGTTASLFTYRYLHRLRERLRGRLTLTAVSDEETFGPWGARYLMEHHPEVHGDCCLNGEPSSPLSIRFGEKGPLWLEFTVSTAGAHGAYVHLSESATKIAAALIADLESLSEIDSPAPGNVGAVLERSAGAVDAALGEGASDIVQRVTVNIGAIRGGLKVNMVPSECVVEVDIRLPVGLGEGAGARPGAPDTGGLPAGADARDQLEPPELVRPRARDGRHRPAQRGGAPRHRPGPGVQPGRDRHAPVALRRCAGLRLRPLPHRHGHRRRARADSRTSCTWSAPTPCRPTTT